MRFFSCGNGYRDAVVLARPVVPAGGVALAGISLALSGCGRENALDPASPQQHRIVHLFWVMTGGAAIGFAFVVFLLWLGWHRRRREGLPLGGGDRRGTWYVVVLGVGVPIVLLSALFVWSDVFVLRATSAPARGSTALTVEVVGHQWWWEVRYPGTRAVTANEIHVPAGERVALVGTSADVIHSFWVPRLNRKIDLIPGRENRIVLEPTDPGRYRGECYEFCGLQHTHMGLEVIADPPARFRAWLATVARDALQPATAEERRGRRVFLENACSACHQLRGTRAHARVGPDLTHLASRDTIAALTRRDTPAELREWLTDPQRVKPGARMPAVPLSEADASALLAYLRSLR
jgi:cytochrome c oxidase subunit 2